MGRSTFTGTLDNAARVSGTGRAVRTAVVGRWVKKGCRPRAQPHQCVRATVQ
jgi:hypothetical protein